MLHGDYWRRSKEVSMGDAYRTLVKAISQGDVPLRLEITAERDLVSAACWGIVESKHLPLPLMHLVKSRIWSPDVQR